MLLLNVFGNLSVGSNVSVYFMKGLEVVHLCTVFGVGFFVWVFLRVFFVFVFKTRALFGRVLCICQWLV